MELLKDEGYIYVSGDQIHRERTEVLLYENEIKGKVQMKFYTFNDKMNDLEIDDEA